MARYTGPVCRLCRRERMKLFLKGPKCMSPKCPITAGRFLPGQHGRDRSRGEKKKYKRIQRKILCKRNRNANAHK
jgi:small subunit ribosomal protein S4